MSVPMMLQLVVQYFLGLSKVATAVFGAADVVNVVISYGRALLQALFLLRWFTCVEVMLRFLHRLPDVA